MAKGQENLKPQNTRTKEEQREIARMGGIASGVARREKRRGQELVRYLLSLDVTDPAIRKKIAEMGLEDMDNETVMHIRQIEKAQKTGDTKAYAAVMKVAGYDEQTVNVRGPLIVPQEEMDALSKWAKKE